MPVFHLFKIRLNVNNANDEKVDDAVVRNAYSECENWIEIKPRCEVLQFIKMIIFENKSTRFDAAASEQSPFHRNGEFVMVLLAD